MSKKNYKKNKEFYEKYIKDNRTEDEIMMDIIHENARKNSNDELHQENKNRKNKGVRRSFKGIFITDLIIICLLIALVVMIWVR